METAPVQDQGLTQRAYRAVDDTPARMPASDGATSRDPKRKLGRAKQGLRSLAVAVTLSTALTASAFYVSGPGTSTDETRAPSAAMVAIARAGSVAAEAVMALAAWMVWAEGGLHGMPGATLAPYAAQLLAAAAWPALALRLGAGWAGMACCAAMAAGAAACVRGPRVRPREPSRQRPRHALRRLGCVPRRHELEDVAWPCQLAPGAQVLWLLAAQDG